MNIKLLNTKEKWEKEILHLEESLPLTTLLSEEGISLDAPCGQKGTCGKCKVKYWEQGKIVPWEKLTLQEQKLLSAQEWHQGIRLACQIILEKDCSIELLGEKKLLIQESFEIPKEEEKLGIAIDIGTTTLGFALVSKERNICFRILTTENQQKVLGADVMSRIHAAMEGKDVKLQHIIEKNLTDGIYRLCGKEALSRVEEIVFSGNTTMLHLLFHDSVESMAKAPFLPEVTKERRGKFLGIDYFAFPCVSAFLGGDIVSGLYHLPAEQPFLLLDLGTNGEMVFYNGKSYLGTSAAAGPALEGGEISCGMASVSGAISHVKWNGYGLDITTIDHAVARGLCGSGVIDCIAELWKANQIDGYGILKEEYISEGYPVVIHSLYDQIRLQQEDIEQVLLAKSAIAAGITLLQEKGSIKEEIQVYLAGGLGAGISVQSANEIGLLGKLHSGQVTAVGNTSLYGAIDYLQNSENRDDKWRNIVENFTTFSLAQEEKFEELFLSGIKIEEL